MSHRDTENSHGNEGNGFRATARQIRHSMTDGFGWTLGAVGGVAAARVLAKGARRVLDRFGRRGAGRRKAAA